MAAGGAVTGALQARVAHLPKQEGMGPYAAPPGSRRSSSFAVSALTAPAAAGAGRGRAARPTTPPPRGRARRGPSPGSSASARATRHPPALPTVRLRVDQGGSPLRPRPARLLARGPGGAVARVDLGWIPHRAQPPRGGWPSGDGPSFPAATSCACTSKDRDERTLARSASTSSSANLTVRPAPAAPAATAAPPSSRCPRRRRRRRRAPTPSRSPGRTPSAATARGSARGAPATSTRARTYRPPRARPSWPPSRGPSPRPTSRRRRGLLRRAERRQRSLLLLRPLPEGLVRVPAGQRGRDRRRSAGSDDRRRHRAAPALRGLARRLAGRSEEPPRRPAAAAAGLGRQRNASRSSPGRRRCSSARAQAVRSPTRRADELRDLGGQEARAQAGGERRRRRPGVGATPVRTAAARRFAAGVVGRGRAPGRRRRRGRPAARPGSRCTRHRACRWRDRRAAPCRPARRACRCGRAWSPSRRGPTASVRAVRRVRSRLGAGDRPVGAEVAQVGLEEAREADRAGRARTAVPRIARRRACAPDRAGRGPSGALPRALGGCGPVAIGRSSGVRPPGSAVTRNGTRNSVPRVVSTAAAVAQRARPRCGGELRRALGRAGRGDRRRRARRHRRAGLRSACRTSLARSAPRGSAGVARALRARSPRAAARRRPRRRVPRAAAATARTRRRRVGGEGQPRPAGVDRHDGAPADERVDLVGGEGTLRDPRSQLLDRQRDQRLARVEVEDDVRRARRAR